jgi:hypothetical protein
MKYYTIEMLENVYFDKYPELTADVIREKAKRLHTVLNTLDINWRRSNCRFYRNVVLYG